MASTATGEIEVVGKSGRISLGQRYAGKVRASAYRDGDCLRVISLHPDHDSTYRR
jgi:hypothetical protein